MWITKGLWKTAAYALLTYSNDGSTLASDSCFAEEVVSLY
jgi:hypothetical protein